MVVAPRTNQPEPKRMSQLFPKDCRLGSICIITAMSLPPIKITSLMSSASTHHKSSSNSYFTSSKLFFLFIVVFSCVLIDLPHCFCTSNLTSSKLPSSTLIFIKSENLTTPILKSNFSNEFTEAANDEEAIPSEDAAVASHRLFLSQDYDQHLHTSSSQFPKDHHNFTFLGENLLLSGSSTSSLSRNCSYVRGDVFCDCDLLTRRYSCYNVQSVEDVRQAFDHLLNVTRLIYWSQLEVHCVEPFASDEPVDSKLQSQSTNSPPNKSFHISYEMFVEGPRFDAVNFVGDCSKPKHYDNLITVDRDVQRIVMVRNMLRMATSCSLLQPKFERLTELVLKDCVVAGDMISSTFSTRCLGQYGTRNEPMQLTRLTISSCNITLVESSAFYNFAELELIDLSDNQISHLTRQAFAPHLYRLRTLRLERNRLTTMAEDFFEKLPELREVILAGNLLTTLPALPSAGPGVAQVLHLANNPWDCRCRLTWLLDEPNDSVRLIADEPKCMAPVNVKNQTLFKGLQIVLDTFC